MSVKKRRLLLVIGALLVGLAGLAGTWGWRQAWAWGHYREAEAALGRQDYSAAADHLARCQEVWTHDPATLLQAAQATRRAGRLREALRLQDLYRSRYGNSPEFLRERRLLAAQDGQLEGLEPLLRKSVAEDDPDTPLILEALAQGYIRTLRVRDAHGCADALLRRQPDHARAWAWRGWALEHLNRNEEALSDYRKAIELWPDHDWARLRLGELLLDFQRYPEALEQFRWLRLRAPGSAEVGLATARCLRGVGELAEARGLLDELTAAHPGEGLILSERGQLSLEEGRPDQAEQWLRKALSLVPFDRQTHYALSRTLQQLGQGEEAEKHFRQSEQLAADQERLKVLERVVSGPEPAAEARCEAGLLCLRLGRFAEGERYLLAALKDDPNHRQAHQTLADHYEKTGRHDLADRHRSWAVP